MKIGIAFDLRSDFESGAAGPDDRLEEYDSLATVEAIEAALRAGGHEPVRMGGGRAFVERALAAPPELVFNIAEGWGTRSREAHVPAVCEMLGIPVTHSDPLTCALTLDKAMAKRVVAAEGVPTPRYAVVERAVEAEDLTLGYPVVAKPLAEGSSIGVRRHSLARDADELVPLVASLVADYRQPVLIEEFCPGAEMTIGVLGQGARARVIAAMEIAPKLAALDNFLYSLEVKRNWQEEVAYHVPPRVAPALLKRAEAVALGAYRALGCRDVARVDLRVGSDGEPKFLEINPLPGLSPSTGDIVILSERSGLPYTRLIGAIVDEARARCGL